MSVRIEALLQRIDDRLGGATAARPLLSVSQTRGVIRHSDLHDRPARADSFETYKVVRPGDIVFNKMSIRSGALGVAHEAGIVTYHYEVLRPRGRTNADFAVYLMKSDWFTAQLIRSERGIGAGGASGVRTTEVPYSVLRTIRVPHWSPEQQRQIADYLHHETAEIDAFIADLRRLRELESERINAEVDISFRAFSDHLVPLKRLGLVQESGVSVNGVAWPATGSEPGVLRTGSVSKGYFDPRENKAVLEPEERERLATPVLADSLIVNRANTPDLVGRGVYVRHAHANLYLSDLLWRVQVGGGCTEYVGAWMASRAYADSIARIRVGASATMQKISFESFSRIGVPLPDERNRRELAIRVDDLRRGRARFEADIDAAIALAKERRAALITAAITGHIDVTSRQKPVVDSVQTAIEEAR